MVQLVTVSQARSNLSSLITQVTRTKQKVILVRNSAPVAVIQPYEEEREQESYLQKLLSIQGDWLDEKEYRDIRESAEKSVKKLHHEK